MARDSNTRCHEDSEIQGIVHEKEIAIRFRDLDAFDHVNNATYLTYLEEARDGWLSESLDDDAAPRNFVIRRIEIEYLGELRQADGTVLARCHLRRVGRSSLTTCEQIALQDGTIVARAETILVALDQNTRKARPLTQVELASMRGEH